MKFTICITLLVTGLFSLEANATNCIKHPIYCQIVTNKPNIKKSYAFKLSNVISKKTRKYKIDSNIFTAILAQESMYKVSAKNCTTGLVEDMLDHKLVKVCTDFGIGQIWYRTANNHKFDFKKLTSDMDYSVEAAAIILKSFKKRYSKRESNWWTRYNASSKDARNKYQDLVERFSRKN